MSTEEVRDDRAVVWVIDDLDENHALVRRSLPPGFEAACDLTGYLTAPDALDALDVLLGDPSLAANLPDVIFMDFFIGGRTGDEVTRAVREAFAARALRGPFIVGHSSARNGSLAILHAGGDLAIEKDRRRPVSPGVRGLFPDVDALRGYAGRARSGARDAAAVPPEASG